MIRYFTYLKHHQGLTKDAFLAQVDCPHLLLALEGPDLVTEDEAGETRRILTDEWNLEAERARAIQMLWLVPIRKTTHNVFADMITLGRASNNDLILPKSSISKFHAYFTHQGESWSLTDAGSRNGTTVEGVRMVPRQACPLRPGAQIEFGRSTPAEFLLPEELHVRVKVDGPQLLEQAQQPAPPSWDTQTLKRFADANPSETMIDLE